MVYLHTIDPIALRLGPLQVHWYGIMYLLGFLVAWWLGRQRIRQGRLPGVDANGFGDLLFNCMLGVILGGRIGYVLFYAFPEFVANPLMLVRIWEGGMSFHGGLLGVLAASWWWSRKHKLHYFDTVDFVAPLVPAGLGFGRLGNYIGGELWGKYTGGGWGVIFPHAEPTLSGVNPTLLQTQAASGSLDMLARHPSQLYQALLEGLVLFLVLWIASRRPRPRYTIAGLFALLYGCFRFMVEFVRVPDAQMGDGGYLAFGWLTMGQLLSLPLILLGLFWLWKARSQPTLQPVPVPATA
ncbi:MAG: prolipoprotein diacylglyceryl transferase [Pseudoxanthomonas suwonensis]|nr:MAG: prolipoprotein diacylglyceryl transferase [Pseudoxanthomonas suwonensis]